MSSTKKIITTAVKIAAAVFLASAAVPLLAEDSISVSNITTEIERTGSGIKIDIEAIPAYSLMDFGGREDFRFLLPEVASSLPDIADFGMDAESFVPPDAEFSTGFTAGGESAAGDVFIEGAVGAGWPALFSGDFSVYRNKGTEPFSLVFSHVTENGYGVHSAADGFSASSTLLSGRKRFAFGDSMLLDAEASYSTKVNGLQGKSPVFSSITSQNVTGMTDVSWNIRDDMKLSGSLGVVFNNQFAGYNGTVPAGTVKSTFGLRLNPEFVYSVNGLTDGGNEWSFKADAGYEGGIGQNRMNAGISGSFRFGGYGTVGAGTDFVWAENMTSGFVIPFEVSYRTGSSMPFTGTVSGGLKTAASDLNRLQKEIPFMFTGVTSYEESEWFAAGEFQMPLDFQPAEGSEAGFFMEKLVPAMKVSFEKTAFGNSRLSAAGGNASTGLLSAELKDVCVLDSKLLLESSFRMPGECRLNVSIGWDASWFDSGISDDSQLLTVKAGVEQLGGSWGGETGIGITFLGEVPVLNISGFYKLTDTMRLEVRTEDFIKLVTGKDRLSAGGYTGRSGFAAMYVKMFF